MSIISFPNVQWNAEVIFWFLYRPSVFTMGGAVLKVWEQGDRSQISNKTEIDDIYEVH